MSTRRLQKWHGAGNDFLVDVTDAAGLSWWSPERALAACDRHTGVGADGVMVAAREGGEVRMSLFNADGSSAEVSGNGLRCLGAALARDEGVSTWSGDVATVVGPRHVSVDLDGPAGHGEVGMGEVTLTAGETDVGDAHVLGRATVGNPHVAVADDDRWSDDDRLGVARRLAGEQLTANVEFVRVVGPSRASMVVVERGVGWTQACGTGSVAVAAILHHLGRVGAEVVIDNPGGALTVRLDGTAARLGGPVQHICDLAWTAP